MQSKNYLTIGDFTPTGTQTAGKSPSLQTQKDGALYQLKRSNCTNWIRNKLGYDSDRGDIMGEFIASKISEAVLNEGRNTELAPSLALVLDDKEKEFRIASRYLNNSNEATRGNYIQMTLDEFLDARNKMVCDEFVKIKNEIVSSQSPYKAILDDFIDTGQNFSIAEMGLNHAIISVNTKEEHNPDILTLDSPCSIKVKDQIIKNITLPKKDLYDGLALSIALGDHDFNPNNFYVIYNKETQKVNIGRIDLGHAFNDLIKNWHYGDTPDIPNSKGGVLDSLNRPTLNGGSKSKLKRDYRGIIPDEEFAASLDNAIPDISIMTGALTQSKDEIITLMDQGKPYTKQCKDSLITVCKHMGKPLSKDQKNKDNESFVESCINNVEYFIMERKKEMKSVANLIRIQSYIDKAIKGEVANEEAMSKIEQFYKNDVLYLNGKGPNDVIEWVSTDNDKKPFKGTLEQYNQHRANQLGIQTKPLVQNEIQNEKKWTAVIASNKEYHELSPINASQDSTAGSYSSKERNSAISPQSIKEAKNKQQFIEK